MPRALVLVREEPHYRRDAFEAGLAAAGYTVSRYGDVGPGDVLVIWNRYGMSAAMAADAEAAGAAVLVAENGYIGTDPKGQQLYALAHSQHNGAGLWPIGDASRWARLGVGLQPWRSDGKHVLVLAQRGIGSEQVRMPADWLEGVLALLAQITDRPVVVRQHPGWDASIGPLDDDLRGAWCAITWGSGAGIRAIAAGVPVIHEFKDWIGAPASRYGLDRLDDLYLGDRRPMFERLAWAQWTIEEIASGEPFRRLLRPA
jgi:hypothetical protein